MNDLKTAIMVLGYNTDAKNFLDVVFGKDGRPGRLTQGLVVAIREKADKVFVVMGRPAEDGRSGSEFTKDTILSDDNLFRMLQDFSEMEGVALEELKALRDKVVPVVSRTDTHFKFREMSDDFEAEYGRVIVVTSPDHMPRTVRDAFAECPDAPFSLEFCSLRRPVFLRGWQHASREGDSGECSRT